MQVGDKFGCLTIIETGLHIQSPKYKWQACKCKCDCGKESIKKIYRIKNNPYKYCSYTCSLKIKDFDSSVPLNKATVKIGDIFNDLTVIEPSFYKQYKRLTKGNLYRKVEYVLCVCKCGKIKNFPCYKLISNMIISCGCNRDTRRTHPQAKDGMKICNTCNINQTTDNFTICRRSVDGLHYECKKCKRNRFLKSKYGITNEDYNKLLLYQNNKCACCQKVFEECSLDRTSYFMIDHNHITGKVRGLLCTKCNHALGLFFDNPSFLQNAIDYLNKDEKYIDDILNL